ncbi:endonuclease/exonuclease/phosphatase family protein [Mangrovibacterium sp.]|uniref:endonuclease/exonuclease/phosphatase family protein n=1 Tax=Mangrovibacterium sp. TaxID=1961364 RepID=UPI003567F22B
MTKNWLVILTFLFLVSCQSRNEFRQVTIVSYNVENLFDTEDDPHVNDNEFLPTSEKKWTGDRYEKKLNDIARVLTDISPDDLPGIIGLAEIENRRVLEDLVRIKRMSPGNYQIVHHDSPDHRGIDVALLYRPDKFEFITSEAIAVNPGFSTRDILYVYGKIKNEDFHFFVNHWPSRIGGLAKTAPHRMFVAGVLKQRVDRILTKNPEANVVIMGDMNDEPHNESMSKVLGAGMPDSNSKLVNLMAPFEGQKKGTYCYRGNWNVLDNLVVSSSLMDEKGFRVVAPVGSIFREAWMEYTDKQGKVTPNRTYGGPNYYGGVSDHFPVYFEIEK